MPEEGNSAEAEEADCVFCKIIQGEIDTALVHSDDEVIAINDINPKAPIHILIIPKKHITSVAEMSREDIYQFGHMLWVAKVLADENRLSRGYKLVMNVGAEGGQSVPHVHLHLLGGESFKEI